MSYREGRVLAENRTLKAREAGFIKLCDEQKAENAKLRELLVGLYSESYIESELASAGNTAIIY